MTNQVETNSVISVIIIFLNAEKYIEETIKSVFAQTYIHWELLLVDDGSTDSSTAIAQGYAERCPNQIRYLEHASHQNCGMSASRNLGIRNAKGEYIALLDSDDVWLPEKLEQQFAILKSQPSAGMVCGPTEKWFSWTGRAEDSKRDQIWHMGSSASRLQYDRLYNPPVLLALSLRREVRPPTPCSVLVRRQVFEELGGFEESFRGMFEDYVFFSKVYLNVPVYITSACLDRYRQRPDSDSHQIKGDHFRRNPKHYSFLNWLERYLSEQGVKDKLLWRSLRRELFQYRHPWLYFVHEISDRLNQSKIQLINQLKEILQRLFSRRFQLWLGDCVRRFKFRNAVKDIKIASGTNCSSNQLIVLCIVRNDEQYIRSFIEYYLSCGITNLVLLDNDSVDNSVSIACQYKEVTILRTPYQFPTYESVMKQYLINRFAKDRPHIFVKINEPSNQVLLEKQCSNCSNRKNLRT